MGIDASYQALPDGCELLVRALQDAAFGELLGLAPFALRRGGLQRPWPAEPEERLFDAAIHDLIARHPGIERRNLITAYRRWDVLHYLLSEGRRQSDPDPRDLGTIAVRGAATLGDLRASQGFPLRHSNAAQVREVTAWLEGLTPDDLRRHYDPPRMEELGVYKFWADHADKEEWALIEEAFADLRTFYTAAAEHGEGALVVLD